MIPGETLSASTEIGVPLGGAVIADVGGAGVWVETGVVGGAVVGTGAEERVGVGVVVGMVDVLSHFDLKWRK